MTNKQKDEKGHIFMEMMSKEEMEFIKNQPRRMNKHPIRFLKEVRNEITYQKRLLQERQVQKPQV